MAPSESDGNLAVEAPCACCSGDFCRCDRVALRQKSGELQVLCFCDCTACSCNSNSSAAAGGLFGKASPFADTAPVVAQLGADLPLLRGHTTDSSVLCHLKQQQEAPTSSLRSSSSSSSTHVLPGSAALLTLDPHSSSVRNPLQNWQDTAAALLQLPDLQVEAVKTNRLQGTLQLFVSNTQQQQQQGQFTAAYSPNPLTTGLHDLRFRVKTQEVASATRAWQKLQQLRAESSTGPTAQDAHRSGCDGSGVGVQEPQTNVLTADSARNAGDTNLSTKLASNGSTVTINPQTLYGSAADSSRSCCASRKGSSTGSCDEPQPQNAIASAAAAGDGVNVAHAADAGAMQQLIVTICGMTCSSCAGAVEDVVTQVPGVTSVLVNLATNTAAVVYDPAITQPQHCLDAIEDAGFSASIDSTIPGDPVGAQQQQQKVQLTVGGMTCSTCAATVEDVVQKISGVVSVSVNLTTNTATVVYEPGVTGPRSCMEAIQDAGFEASMAQSGNPGTMNQACTAAAREARIWRRRLLWTLLLAIPVAVLSMMAMEPNMQMKLEGPHGCGNSSISNAHSTGIALQGNGSSSHAALLAAVGNLHAADAEPHVVHGGNHSNNRSSSDSNSSSDAIGGASAQGLRQAAAAAVANGSLPSAGLGVTKDKAVQLQLTAAAAAAAAGNGAGRAGGASMHQSGKLVGGLPAVWLVQMVLATGVQFGAGRVFYTSAYYSLKHRRPNMAVLVVLGTTAAYIYSIIAMALAAVQPGFMGHVYFESSVLIIAFVCLGKWIEARAKAKMGDAVTALLRLAPKTALLVLGSLGSTAHPGSSASPGKAAEAVADADGRSARADIQQDTFGELLSAGCEVKELPLELVQVGDILKVLPGASIPTDGTLISGMASVDESLITGEAQPVTKHPGDDLIGGSVNGGALVFMRVGRVGHDTVLSGIVRLVQEAQANKAGMQVLADKVAAYFVPVIIALATLTFVIWIIVGYGTNLLGDVPSSTWAGVPAPWLLALLHAISVLVIACPCALGLATPTVAMVATGVAARHGVLIKGASVLELAHKVGILVFDKTGTLTQGKCQLQQVLWLQQGDAAGQGFNASSVAESSGPRLVSSETVDQQCDTHELVPNKGNTDPSRSRTRSSSSSSGAGRPASASNSADVLTEEATLARKQLLQLFAAVESGSEHPLAKAVVQYIAALQQEACFIANDGGVAPAAATLHIEHVEAVPGRGVIALVDRAWHSVAVAATGAMSAQSLQSMASGNSTTGTGSPSLAACNSSTHHLQSATTSGMTAPSAANDMVSVLIGNVAWMEDQGVPLSELTREHLSNLELAEGATVVIAAVGGIAVALLAIADRLKPEAVGVLRALESRGVEPWMITGDSRRVATALAKKLQLPLRQVVAEATPAMKVQMVQQLRQQAQSLTVGRGSDSSCAQSKLPNLQIDIGNRICSGFKPRTKLQQGFTAVAMVGDGINDSPAISAADVGLAVGGGADIAAQSADIVLMKADLGDVLVALDISTKAYTRMRWNFIYAYGYNTLAIPLAAGVLFPATHSLFPAWVAALAMAASSVSVVSSSLLLRLYRPAAGGK